MTPDISIITSTKNRPKLLAMLIHQIRLQQFTGTFEHIIVTDGYCEPTKRICKLFGATCIRSNPERIWGAKPKDKGVTVARGRYLVFWDDDNLYHPFALQTLLETAEGHDVGVVHAESSVKRYGEPYTMPLPNWKKDGTDYLCVCVRRELAKRFQFQIPCDKAHAKQMVRAIRRGSKSPAVRAFLDEQKPYDRRWTRQVFAAAESIRVSSVSIGVHL